MQKKVGPETDLSTREHVINDKLALQSSGERREFSVSEFWDNWISTGEKNEIGPLIPPSATIQMVCRFQEELDPGTGRLWGNHGGSSTSTPTPSPLIFLEHVFSIGHWGFYGHSRVPATLLWGQCQYRHFIGKETEAGESRPLFKFTWCTHGRTGIWPQ